MSFLQFLSMYKPLPIIDELLERMGHKRKTNKGGYNLIEEPSVGFISSAGNDQRVDEGRYSRLV